MSLTACQSRPAIDAAIYRPNVTLYQLQPSFHISSTEPEPTARARSAVASRSIPAAAEEQPLSHDPFRFDGTRSYDDNKKYQNCGEWYGSQGEHIPENGWVDHSESYACWEKKCDGEIKALAQCTNELMLKNVYGADCTCESNPLPENSKDGWVPPPGVKACKPK